MHLTMDDIGTFVALGGTYDTHLDENDRSYRWPDFWVVPREGIIHENQPIQLPQKTEDVKPGAELTAVLATDLWQADPEEAWESIKGFTISNDVTASGDWPLISDPNYGGTGVGYKSFPTFSPIRSDVVEKKSVEHYADLEVEVRIDGEVAVSGTTAQMAFSIPELVSFASHITKLHENDVVALGDPGNCTQYLDSASEVSCYIESIGELQNPVETID